MPNIRNARRTQSILLALIASVTLTFLGGCTPWATYPPIKGAVDISNPTLAPIPGLMSNAIWQTYVNDGGGDSKHIVFNLPEGTPALVFDKVLARLGGGRPMYEPGEPAIHVTEVRVRASEAHVDVVRPRPDGGEPQKLTLSFRRDLVGGFTLSRIRPWRFPVDTPAPHYGTAFVDRRGDEDEGVTQGDEWNDPRE